jgi:hypothetical protein
VPGIIPSEARDLPRGGSMTADEIPHFVRDDTMGRSG